MIKAVGCSTGCHGMFVIPSESAATDESRDSAFAVVVDLHLETFETRRGGKH